MELPEYTRRMILAVGRNPALFPRGEVSNHYVKHDDWCRLLVQGGACDCKPDVYVEIEGQLHEVTAAGNLLKVGRVA